MFQADRPMKGYHGAWTRTEQQIPLIVAGAGIRRDAALGTCELIDLAPTLSFLLGGPIPEQPQGRILLEVLDSETAEACDYGEFILAREQLLDELKFLKKEFAGGGMYRDEYENRAAELWQQAERNAEDMEAARRSNLEAYPSGD